MGFKHLEQKLRRFFHDYHALVEKQQKARIRERVLYEFEQQKTSHKIWSWLRIVFETPHLRFASVAASFFLLIGFSALFTGSSIAGEIDPKFGSIEIIRDGKTHIVRKRTKLKVGDIVQVADNSHAEIISPQKTVSSLKPETSIRVMDKNKIYLSQGMLKSQAFGVEEEISTSRGIIRPSHGADFQVDVSETGETTVALKENSAEIVDWLDGKVTLEAGEEIVLRIDSEKLRDHEIPKSMKLSIAQLDAIDSKLAIARTKFFSGLEKELDHSGTGTRDIDSAQKSFRSIVQVLKSDRHLNILRRANPDFIKNEDVYAALETKSENEILLKEVKAVETLFALYNEDKSKNLFLPRGESIFFSRYVLIDQIFTRGNSEQKVFANVLKEEYIVSLLRKIINQEVKMDQVAVMSVEIGKLPAQNGKAKIFLKDLSNHLDEYLASVLDEKIQTL